MFLVGRTDFLVRIIELQKAENGHNDYLVLFIKSLRFLQGTKLLNE